MHTDLHLRCPDRDFEQVCSRAVAAGMNVDTVKVLDGSHRENRIKVYGEHAEPLPPLFEGLDVEIESEHTVES